MRRKELRGMEILLKEIRRLDPTRIKEPQLRRREFEDIVLDILRTAEEEIVQTRLVYGSNLNFERAITPFIVLEEFGLIRARRSKKTIIVQTTEEGQAVLAARKRYDSEIEKILSSSRTSSSRTNVFRQRKNLSAYFF